MIHNIEVIYPCDTTVKFHYVSNHTQKELLEDVYHMFNCGSGREHHIFKNKTSMRSLSVNDFVKIDGDIFQCANVGWIPVDENYLNTITEMVNVVLNNDKKEYCPFSSLCDVMWAVYQ